jgi:hypothetical protein
MKHIKLFEEFVSEGFSSSDLKKLREFAEQVAYEIASEYEDDFDRKSRNLDPDDYTADQMFDYIVDWGGGMTVKEIMNEFDWRSLTWELGLA